MQGKKRSDQGDEFLIDKKNPLVLPPDFDKLPTPGEANMKSIKDIENFRFARNDIKARSVSTNPERLISWAEHLEWWLGNNIDKFIMEQHGKYLIPITLINCLMPKVN